MSKNCLICGKPSYMFYGYCKEHLEMKSAGKIVKCPDCGKWHLVDEKCQCQKAPIYKELPSEGFNKCVVCGTDTNGYAFCLKCFKKYSNEEKLAILNGEKTINKSDEKTPKEEENKVIVIDEKNKSKCIVCGKHTDGLLFCPSCYYNYKNKELLFKITNCTSIELLDENYEGRYTCKDGHIVKSKSERDIDNYLFEHGISHAYERELPYGATDKEVLHPDFYLPNYLGKGKHVYIEHWGYNENNIQYTKTKKFKMPIYKDLKITLICTYEKTDMGKIETVLDRKLNPNFIKESEIIFKNKNAAN